MRQVDSSIDISTLTLNEHNMESMRPCWPSGFKVNKVQDNKYNVFVKGVPDFSKLVVKTIYVEYIFYKDNVMIIDFDSF